MRPAPRLRPNIYDELKIHLQIAQVGSFIVGLFADKLVPDVLIERLKHDLPDQFQFTIRIDPQKVHFPTFFNMNWEPFGVNSNIFHIIGITELADEWVESLFQYLQYGRDQFKAQPYALVFWLDEALEKELFYKAPDFHHWVTGSYDFTDLEADDDDLAEAKAENAVPTDKMAAYLDKTVWQFDHWSEIESRDFLLEVMGRVDLRQSYVPSSYTDETGRKQPLSELLADFLDDEQRHFLALLADFGMGKSSFSLCYFVELARKFLAKQTDRIPVFVTLKDYQGELDLERLIRREFYDRYGIELSFSVFTELALQGRFVIFVDGFDEMTATAGNAAAIHNLNQLTRLTFENILFLTEKVGAPRRPNKVVLTSRTHYFLTETQADKLLRISKTRLYRLYAYKEELPLPSVRLNEFDESDVRAFIAQKFPQADDRAFLEKTIAQTYNLQDLTKRPLLLKMISESLPTLQTKRQINAADLYKVYTDLWIEQEDAKSVLTPAGKRQLMWNMACHIFEKGGDFSLHYTKLIESLSEGEKFSPLKEPALSLSKGEGVPAIFKGEWTEEKLLYDLTTCSFLNRDAAGNFKFMHKSFMEFFIAEKLARVIDQLDKSPFFKSPEVRFFIDGLTRNDISLRNVISNGMEERDGRFFNPIAEIEMVYIPPGPFIYGEGEEQKTVNIQRGYFIGKYPVTNADFKRFMDTGGYAQQAFWSTDGWQRKSADKWSEPRYWRDEKWKQADCPAVGVSWYEAEAYANWCGSQLPTEAMWEKAARGSDGRRYPWGNEGPTDMHSNFSSKVGRTTPVDRYPSGQSPYGVWDLSGNVWEWNADLYSVKNTLTARVLRGGSWGGGGLNCRSAYRLRDNPADRVYDGGFRVARGF